MANVSVGTIISSMSVDLNKKIFELSDKISNKKASLEEKSLLDKILTNRDINSAQREERMLTQLSSLLFEIKNNKKYKAVISDETKEDIEILCSLLNEKELDHFRKLFTNCLKKERDDRLKELRGSIEKSKIIVDQLLGGKKFAIQDDLDSYESMLYSAGIDAVSKEYGKKELVTNINYNRRSIDDHISLAEQKMLYELTEMHKFGELKYDVSTTAIVENLAGIRNSFVARTRINTILRVIANVFSDLEKIDNLETMDVKTYLSKLEVKYARELDKINKYLGNFDFTSVKMQVENRKSRIEFLEDLRNNMAMYEEMSYQLEKVKNETPDDVQTIIILNEKLSVFASKGNLNANQLEKASDDGVKRYHAERVLMEDSKNGGQELLNDYFVYYRSTKDKKRLLSLPEYVKMNNKIDVLGEVKEDSNDPSGLKM